MKKATPSICVKLAFSEKTTPEWFRYLSKISSGHVRAEVIRAHLMGPGSVDIFSRETPSDDAELQTEIPAQEPSKNQDGGTLEADDPATSSAAPAEENNHVEPPQNTGENSGTENPPGAHEDTGDLASAIVRSFGMQGWESNPNNSND